jgi:hypothetical protein
MNVAFGIVHCLSLCFVHNKRIDMNKTSLLLNKNLQKALQLQLVIYKEKMNVKRVLLKIPSYLKLVWLLRKINQQSLVTIS